jgi:hypothetical protein
VAAFSRPKGDTKSFKMHSISVIELAEVDLSSEDSKPRYDSVQVGYGPCSVVTLDTEMVG